MRPADDTRSDTRCISLTSVFKAMDNRGFFVSKLRKDVVVEYGPLWAKDNNAILKRTSEVLAGYFTTISEEARIFWQLGAAAGGGLAMNDGVTVCINILRSVFHHLQNVKRIDLSTLSDAELCEAIKLWALFVGKYFASRTAEQLAQFRSFRGVQGQTAATRRLEEYIRKSKSDFDPPGLNEFLQRERAQTTTRAFEEIQTIESILQATVISELKSEFGTDESAWWFPAVPKSVRKKVDDRINEDGGKKGGREANFDLIDYREMIHQNWLLFEGRLARGKGAKDNRTKWISEINELRKPVMHASKGTTLPITEEQLSVLQDTREWLQNQVTNGNEA